MTKPSVEEIAERIHFIEGKFAARVEAIGADGALRELATALAESERREQSTKARARQEAQKEMQVAVTQSAREIRRLEKAVVAAEARAYNALRQWLRHGENCGVSTRWFWEGRLRPDCDCGLDAAIAEIRATEKESPR